MGGALNCPRPVNRGHVGGSTPLARSRLSLRERDPSRYATTHPPRRSPWSIRRQAVDQRHATGHEAPPYSVHSPPQECAGPIARRTAVPEGVPRL